MGPGSTDNSRRFTLLAEIAVILAPVLMIVWGTPLLIEEKRRRDAVDFYLMVAAVLIGLALNRYRRESLPEIGLRLDNLLEAGRELLAFTATTCAIILGVGVAFGSVNLGMRFLTQLTVLPFWGLLQQYGLLGVINRRLRRLCARERWSACITAAIFSAIHLPNRGCHLHWRLLLDPHFSAAPESDRYWPLARLHERATIQLITARLAAQYESRLGLF